MDYIAFGFICFALGISLGLAIGLQQVLRWQKIAHRWQGIAQSWQSIMLPRTPASSMTLFKDWPIQIDSLTMENTAEQK